MLFYSLVKYDFFGHPSSFLYKGLQEDRKESEESANLPSSMHTNLEPGSCVKLFGLKADKYNGKIGHIIVTNDERVGVALQNGPCIKVKETNVLRICSNCFCDEEDGSIELKVCSSCFIATYCSRGCQKMHFKKVLFFLAYVAVSSFSSLRFPWFNFFYLNEIPVFSLASNLFVIFFLISLHDIFSSRSIRLNVKIYSVKRNNSCPHVFPVLL